MDRIAMLSEILAANPEDTFARYGLALEYSKAGQIDEALQEFRTLIEKNPDYTPAYFMAAQALAGASRIEEAKRWLVAVSYTHLDPRNCLMIECSIGPRQISGLSPGLRKPTEMTLSPCESMGTIWPSPITLDVYKRQLSACVD